MEAPDETQEPAAEPATVPRAAPGGAAALRVLRHREFALFWWAQVISLTGGWMQHFAQGLLVDRISGQALALGMVNFVLSLPTLVLMPLGGVAADRMERRQILIWTQWALVVLAGIAGVLVHLGQLQLWHIYALALPLGIVTAYELPAFQSFYPQLIDKEELPQAISLNQAAFHGSRIFGPALAAAVVATFGMAAAFYCNALSFLPVVAALLMIRSRPAAVEGRSGGTGAFMREGFQYVREQPRLRSLLGLTAITTLCIFPNMAVLMPHYAGRVLHVDAAGLGTLMSVSGLGSLIGAGILLNIPPGRRVAWMLGCAISLLGTLSVLAWSHNLWLSVAAISLMSMAISLTMGISSVMIQEGVPDELRGRVMSLYSLTFTGVMPFASLLVTLLADSVGMRWELQGAAVLYTMVAVALVYRVREQE